MYHTIHVPKVYDSIGFSIHGYLNIPKSVVEYFPQLKTETRYHPTVSPSVPANLSSEAVSQL